MPGEQLSSTYSERITRFEDAIQKQTGRINLLSLARLVVLVSAIWILVPGIRNHEILLYTASFLLAVLFLFLVTVFNRYKGKRELLRKLRQLNEVELACLDHRYGDRPDGAEYTDLSHPWSHDLDLFGKGSLFQYLNRTSTEGGGRILAGMLTLEPGNAERIRDRQDILADLKDRIDFRQYFTATGELLKEKPGDQGDLSRWTGSTAYISRHSWLFYLALGVSLCSLTSIIWGMFDPSRFFYLLYLLVINMMVLSPFILRTQRYQEAISRKHALLEGYARLLGQIAGTSFEHAGLQDLQRKSVEGMRNVAHLSKLLQIFDQRLNMLLGSVLNGLFLFDFIMLFLLERWKRQHRQDIMGWIEITGRMDALISLSGFAFNHPDFSLPEFDEDASSMELRGLGHPLIPAHRRVNNDLVVAGEKVVVITGANMAGKSTFLRSMGVNMVLGYAGCPVCASGFRCAYMGLQSSMRTADSLKDEESYFLAEIRKLQRIVHQMEQGKPMLILLDEVLKGTNTTDKKLGSVGLIRKSLNYPVRCLIATHDLSLGELEKEYPGQVVNYCFESYIRGMELSFDYTIRKGIATNMNASFLMKKMGIMD